jgi:diguanylate cyclase (GGDEF)-like protein
MDSTAVILFGLVATSLLLCVALAVAWRSFGRETHAALWAFAYGLSAANWTANLLKVWLLPVDSGLTLLSVVCSIGSFALIALGFRRRAGLRLRLDAIVAAAVVTIAFSGWAILRSHEYGVSRGLMILFCSAMLVISALSLRVAGRDGRRATGGAAFWMLTLFAAYMLGLGVLALFSPAGTSGPLFELYHLMMLMGVPTGLFGVGLFAMFLLAADLAEAMRQLAASDPLTGILNRRGFDQAAMPMIAQCKRRGRLLALVIADIDRFKAINDRFGHSLGDTVLQRFTAHITASIGQQDLFGRLGGEEFVLMLPETGAAAAVEAMERIRAGLADAVPELAASGALTASFGVAVLNGPHDMLCDLLQRADDALYRSKLDGRDRISVAPAHGSAVDRLSAAWPTMRRAAG